MVVDTSELLMVGCFQVKSVSRETQEDMKMSIDRLLNRVYSRELELIRRCINYCLEDGCFSGKVGRVGSQDVSRGFLKQLRSNRRSH